MERIFEITQLILSILLIVVILLQNRGSGLSGIFGGSGAVFRTKRGMEKKLSIATIVLAILWVGLSIAILVI